MANVSLQLLFLIILSKVLYFDTIKLGFCHDGLNVSCIEIEKKALLGIKSSLSDPSGRLSSWIEEDCCKWRGVSCNTKTKHVIRLDLRNPISDHFDRDTLALGGKVSSSLLDLKYLSYFDLSMNNFEGAQIPNFFGSLKNLRYLNLSLASFGGSIPHSLHNLSNLQYLDLNSYYDFLIDHNYGNDKLVANELWWVSDLPSLKHLNLGNINLSGAESHWLQAINTLPSLLELHLPWCQLHNLPPSLPFVNFTSLLVLDISSNDFNSTIPQWLFNLSSLTQLDLSDNSLRGLLPDGFSKLGALEELDLSLNGIGGKISGMLGKLCNLKTLALYSNDFTDDITNFISSLSECSNNSLGKLYNLKELYLGDNRMSGNITKKIGQLWPLVVLDLSGNLWGGIITEAHLMNLSSLKHLTIGNPYSSNISLAFNISSDWVPPFKLSSVQISSCQLGPKFPEWLKTQTELTTVVFNNAKISDTIPDWFIKLNLQLAWLDFANNQLSGEVPNSLRFTSHFSYVDLSSNNFEGPFLPWSSNVSYLSLSDNLLCGPIPQDIGIRMPNLTFLDISKNFLDGNIPMSLGNMTSLKSLYISNNRLSGKIPQIWDKMPYLFVVDMSNNNLFGAIPSSMGSLISLELVALSENNLSGELPSSLRNCTYMNTLDLGDNQLSGNLPIWIGESMPSLWILRLRNNSLTGDIPSQLCKLSFLHILDLSKNYLSGSIPPCIGSLIGFKTNSLHPIRVTGLKVVTKGRTLFYDSTLLLMYSIDLSDNSLSGEIPANITSLCNLDTLNLSMNHLTGKIPSDIGSLKLLETLDLSVNHLLGPIPVSMASLTFLNHLNLSYNNLSGYIPSSNQFQSFNDPSIYVGNAALCGSPLLSKCANETSFTGGDKLNEGNGDREDDDELEKLKFFVVVGLGFFLGFWGVCGTLIIKKHMRDAYFHFLQRMKDKICEILTSIEVKILRSLHL